jgi:hypothetical protein
MIVRFSELHKITRKRSDDWFDPILSTDTRLFLDPSLIYRDSDKIWPDAYERLVDFFNLCLELVAKRGGAAARQLMFPEPAEFCLGYAASTPLGNGTAEVLRSRMQDGAQEMVSSGIGSVERFEELALFGYEFGPDRISDIICNVLKADFVEYTAAVARRHPGIGIEFVAVPHAIWDPKRMCWWEEKIELPVNPTTGRAVLLAPERFLRQEPIVRARLFWDWAWTHERETLLGGFDYEAGPKVDPEKIARLARRNPKFVTRFIEAQDENPAEPYDLSADPDGELSWYDDGLTLARRSAPPPPPDRPDRLRKWLEGMLFSFRHTLEQRDGRALLWTGEQPRNSHHARALFRTAIWEQCRQHGVDFGGLPNGARGPVDFGSDKGWKRRALVEVKPVRNTASWSGIEARPKRYWKSNRADCGFFVALAFSDRDLERDRIQQVRRAAKVVSETSNVKVTPIVIDARPSGTDERGNAVNPR